MEPSKFREVNDLLKNYDLTDATCEVVINIV